MKQEADMSWKGEGYRWEINKAVSYQRSDASVRNISIWWACERDVCRRKWRSTFILKCTTRDDFKNQSGMPGFVAPWSHYQFVSIAIANRSAPCGLLPLGKVPMSAATALRAPTLPSSSNINRFPKINVLSFFLATELWAGWVGVKVALFANAKYSPVQVLKVAGVTCMNKTGIFRVWNANAMSDNASITCLQIPADVAVILPDCDALYSYPTSY